VALQLSHCIVHVAYRTGSLSRAQSFSKFLEKKTLRLQYGM